MAHRLLIVLLFSCQFLFAQSESEEGPYNAYIENSIEKKPFDQSAWNKAKKGIDYTEIDVPQPEEEKMKKDSLNQQELTPAKKKRKKLNSPFFQTVFNVLLIIAAIAVVALIISQFLGAEGLKFRKNKNISSEEINYDVAQVEEKLIESDLDRMIRLAEEAGDYKLALRLQYLAGVKSLATNSHIVWKKAKTNRTYLNEIGNLKIKDQFSENILIYERIWFGDTLLDEENYKALKPIFQQFNHEVAIVSARYADKQIATN